MTIKTIPSRIDGVRVEIEYDPEPQYDHDSYAIITHAKGARYTLGLVPKTAEEDAQIAKWVRDGQAIGVPVWAYVHSGSTVRAAFSNPFGCPWDSGRSGWVYVKTEDALKEHGRKNMSPKLKQAIEQYLINEVETFNQYLNGEVYGVSLYDGDELIDSCWGIYGMEYAEQEAQAMIKYHLARHYPMKQLPLPIEFA